MHRLGMFSSRIYTSAHSIPATVQYIPYFFCLSEHADIGALLKQKNRWFIETGSHDCIQSQLFTLLSKQPSFAINITSKHAYQFRIALAIANNLQQRFCLRHDDIKTLQTCLQEAVLNAIIHGNLEIESTFDSLHSFENYCATIEHKLQILPFRDRRVTIAAWNQSDSLKVAISDQGNGFVLASDMKDAQLPYGRGQMLIQSLASKIWVGEDSRTLWLSFTL